MKPNNLIIFLGQRFELCKAFGLFGKENLLYQSEFDHNIYKNSKYVKYYFEKLNADIIFIAGNTPIESLDTNGYDNLIIMISERDIYSQKYIYYRNKYPNCKLVFLWMYGEVFSKSLLENCKKANLDLLLSGSNQTNLTDIGVFDYKLNFKFFYYYIGYYYLTSLISNLKEKSYDVNQLPIFTYSKANNQSNWRSDILNELHSKFPNRIYNGSSINDSYDLEFTKYKHFETINDYSHKNYNLVFETIDCRNNMEYFATEKTFKALFFNNPFYLVAPSDLIEELSKDFYLLNSSFYNLDSFVGSETLKENYNYHVEMSKMNLSKLLDYVHDYSYIEYFKKLLN
jgi:hypothetical protein